MRRETQIAAALWVFSLLACGAAAYGQDLFEQHESQKKTAAEEEAAVEGRESIF